MGAKILLLEWQVKEKDEEAAKWRAQVRSGCLEIGHCSTIVGCSGFATQACALSTWPNSAENAVLQGQARSQDTLLSLVLGHIFSVWTKFDLVALLQAKMLEMNLEAADEDYNDLEGSLKIQVIFTFIPTLFEARTLASSSKRRLCW